MVASDAYYDMFAELARRDPEGATLPLRVGASMRCDDYGAFGFTRAFKRWSGETPRSYRLAAQ